MNIPTKLKNRLIVCVVLLAVTLALNIVNFIVLPDVVAVQWSKGEATNFMPKNEALIITLGVAFLCMFVWQLCEQSLIARNILNGMSDKIVFAFGTLLSSVGAVINIVLLIMN